MSAKQMLLVVAVVAVGMVCWAGSAQASVINVDFDTPTGSYTGGTYSGTAAAPDTGTTWNSVNVQTGVTSQALVDSNGGSTAVTLTMGASYDGSGSADTMAGSTYDTLMRDNTHNNGVSGITLSGLTDGTYDFWGYTPYGLGAMTLTSGANSVTGTEPGYFDNNGTLAKATEHLQITVTGGSLTIKSTHRMSGFQLMPEPATMALLGLGGLGVLLGRKRK